MCKLIQFILVTAAVMAAPSASAEMEITVFNYQVMLLESDVAKQHAVDAEKKFDPQLSKLRNLERDVKTLQNKLTSNGSKMSRGSREKAELDFKQKARDFRFQPKELNKSKVAADRDMLKRLEPEPDQAVEETVKKGGYDMTIERGVVIGVKPQYDITRQVIK